MHLTFGVLNHSHSSFQKLKICEIIKISEIIKFNDLCQNILNCELVKIGQTPIIKLRILLKQNTALLSYVSQCVSVSVTGVTSQVFSII